MNEKQIEKLLDYDGWIAYKKGSKKFKEAVILGLRLQMIQVDHMLKRLDAKFKQ